MTSMLRVFEEGEELSDPKEDYSWRFNGFRNRTPAQLSKEFAIFRSQHWDGSLEQKWIETQLRDIALINTCGTLDVDVNNGTAQQNRRSYVPITNVVALGVGSLHDVNHEGSEHSTRIQLAVVLTILETLTSEF
jgi:hypothetical protein